MKDINCTEKRLPVKTLTTSSDVKVGKYQISIGGLKHGRKQLGMTYKTVSLSPCTAQTAGKLPAVWAVQETVSSLWEP